MVQTQLIGQDAAKLISEASRNSDLKKLTGILAARGYAQEKDSMTLANNIAVTNDTMATEMQFVTFPFGSKANVTAYILWMKKDGREIAQAAISGPASAIPKPLEIVKANDTFKQIEKDLILQGYTVDMEHAMVNEGLSTEADVALVTISKVNATGTTPAILALVDLSQNEVVALAATTSWQCDACGWIATRVCSWGLGGTWGCIEGCAGLCGWLFLDPPLMAFCWASCAIICVVAMSIGCSWGAMFICTQAGFC